MAATTLPAAPSIDPGMHAQALAYVTKLVYRYERELEAPPVAEVTIAHQAIVRSQLEDWRRRLAHLRGTSTTSRNSTSEERR